MPYTIEFSHSRPKKFIKKSSSELATEIETQLAGISKDPYCYKPLTGLKDIHKCQFKFKGVQYRIAFKVYAEERVVGILHIGTRENFYDELKRILD